MACKRGLTWQALPLISRKLRAPLASRTGVLGRPVPANSNLHQLAYAAFLSGGVDSSFLFLNSANSDAAAPTPAKASNSGWVSSHSSMLLDRARASKSPCAP